MRFNQKGQVFVLAVVILSVIMVSTVVVINSSLLSKINATLTSQQAEAIHLAEAGVDKALASFNKTAGTYSGETETFIGDGSYAVTVTSKDSSTAIITSTGYIPNKTKPTSKKTITIQVSKGLGTAFNYGMQVGEGGLQLQNSAKINGSVYSNGNISASNNSIINGDVWVAGGTAPTANQQADCSSPNCSDFIFGKTIGGNSQFDVAQSFRPTVTQVINKIQLKLKKVGSPANLTVRLMSDLLGQPSKIVLASGTLNASLVTTQSGFTEVALTTSPTLTANTPYWIMIDGANDVSNYWSWSEDTAQTYLRGNAYYSDDWQATVPVWSTVTGDLGFKTFMGGVATFLTMTNGSQINGNAHVNTINSATISGDAYYQVLSDSTVNGSSYPDSADPPSQAFPVSDANLADWQSQATAGGVTNGNLSGSNSCHVSLGPAKINGDLNYSNGCVVTVTSPLWVTGSITLSNAKFVLASSTGSLSGIILVDGLTSLSSSADIQGSGSPGSYLMLLSSYDSTSNGVTAIDIGNSNISGIVYAPKGLANLGDGATFREINAWKVIFNSATLNYDTGLAGVIFSSGPSGSFSAIKGTYQLK